MGKLIGLLAAIAIIVLVFAGPSTWIVMLAAGNLGFSQFGFVDCLPLGIIIALLTPSTGS